MNAKPRAKLPSRLGATAPSVLAIAMPADLEKAAGPMNLIVDSGSDYHVVGNRDMLINIEPCSKVAQIAGGNDLDIIITQAREPTDKGIICNRRAHRRTGYRFLATGWYIPIGNMQLDTI